MYTHYSYKACMGSLWWWMLCCCCCSYHSNDVTQWRCKDRVCLCALCGGSAACSDSRIGIRPFVYSKAVHFISKTSTQIYLSLIHSHLGRFCACVGYVNVIRVHTLCEYTKIDTHFLFHCLHFSMLHFFPNESLSHLHFFWLKCFELCSRAVLKCNYLIAL